MPGSNPTDNLSKLWINCVCPDPIGAATVIFSSSVIAVTVVVAELKDPFVK